jgi:hypothetical protein
MSFGLVDQPHRSLRQLIASNKLIVNPRQDIDNGITDGKNVDGRLRHGG